MHNIISTRSSAALAAVAFLGLAGCETTSSPEVDCATKPALCDAAASLAEFIDSKAGADVTDQISLGSASAEGATVTVRYDIMFTRNVLRGGDFRTAQSIAYNSLVLGFCRPETQFFLDQGGTVRVLSYSSDGLLVTSTTLDQCPAQSFARE